MKPTQISCTPGSLNQLPPECTVQGDIRITPFYNVHDVTARINEYVAEINANPRDDKDHPFGVWTLPPVRRSSARGQAPDPRFDHTTFDAIGESDRMTLRFRKPLKP